MDTDVVLNRGDLATMRDLVKQEARRSGFAEQRRLFELADSLHIALGIPSDEAPQFRLSYGETVRPSQAVAEQMRTKLGELSTTLSNLTVEYVQLANRYAANLIGQERAREHADLMEYMGAVLADLGRAQLSGAFAVPPGALALYSVQVDQDRDVPHRLFLDHELAKKAALPDYEPQPRVAWAKEAPDKVSLWFNRVALGSDGQERESHLDRQWVQPESHADSLVDPVVNVSRWEPRSAMAQCGTWYTVTGFGPDMDALTSAVARQVSVLQGEIVDREIAAGRKAAAGRPAPPIV